MNRKTTEVNKIPTVNDRKRRFSDWKAREMNEIPWEMDSKTTEMNKKTTVTY